MEKSIETNNWTYNFNVHLLSIYLVYVFFFYTLVRILQLSSLKRVVHFFFISINIHTYIDVAMTPLTIRFVHC